MEEAGGIVDSEAFRKWFGNSRAVDRDGSPLVLCHGTRSDISSFDSSLTVDGGIHLGTPGQASMRISGPGSNVMPLFLRAENPRRSRDTGGDWEGKIRSARAAGHDCIVYLNRYEGMTTDIVARLSESGNLERLDSLSDREFRLLVPEAEDSWIAFDPRQMKSALGNSGSFDPSSPDLCDRTGPGLRPKTPSAP